MGYQHLRGVNCKSKPELFMIQDPASKLNPREEVSVVRYVIPQENWQNVSSKD